MNRKGGNKECPTSLSRPAVVAPIIGLEQGSMQVLHQRLMARSARAVLPPLFLSEGCDDGSNIQCCENNVKPNAHSLRQKYVNQDVRR